MPSVLPAAPSYDKWLKSIAPPGTAGSQLADATARLATLEKTGTLGKADLAKALEPLGLPAAELAGAIEKFRDAFQDVVRPDAAASFFDPKEMAKQAAWHADIKRPVIDPISGQSMTPQAVGAGAAPKIPDAPAFDFAPEALADLLEQGPLFHDGNSISVNETAKTLAVTLETKTRAALAAPSFEQRNLLNAEVIAMESAVLAASAADVKDPAKVGELYKLFFAAAYEAGAAFRPAFTEDGKKSTAADADTRRTAAQSAAGGVAFRALPQLFSLVAGTPADQAKAEATRIIRGASVEDVASIASGDLGLNVFPSAAKIAETLKAVVSPDDYFFKELDKLENRDSDHALLNLGVRLANVTWKAGQVHRAAWEGTDRRINPKAGDRLAVFNPYDNLKADMYNATFNTELAKAEGEGLPRQKALGRTQERAFARVVFEIYKDLVELKKAAAA